MNSKVILAASAALCIAAPAIAATPTLDGNYILTINEYCQPKMTVGNGALSGFGNVVNGINLSSSNVTQNLLLVTFNSKKHKATFAGFQDQGSVMLQQNTGNVNGQSGTVMAQSPLSGASDWSNTDTTFTFGADVYNALFGQVDKKGVAHYAAFQVIFNGDQSTQCTEQGVLALQ